MSNVGLVVAFSLPVLLLAALFIRSLATSFRKPHDEGGRAAFSTPFDWMFSLGTARIIVAFMALYAAALFLIATVTSI